METNKSVVPFQFQGMEVRTVIIEDEIYFVVSDACKVLELDNVSRAIDRLDPDGVTQSKVTDSSGRVQTMAIANEPNLYRLIFRSEKPQAKAFQNWVYKEIIPSIRKTGSYSVSSRETTPARGLSPDVLDDPRRLTLAIRSERALLQHLQAELALRYPDRARISMKRVRGPQDVQERILHVVRRHGPISLNTLHHSYMKRWDAESIEKGVETLLTSGQIVRLQTERGWTKYAVA